MGYELQSSSNRLSLIQDSPKQSKLEYSLVVIMTPILLLYYAFVFYLILTTSDFKAVYDQTTAIVIYAATIPAALIFSLLVVQLFKFFHQYQSFDRQKMTLVPFIFVIVFFDAFDEISPYQLPIYLMSFLLVSVIAFEWIMLLSKKAQTTKVEVDREVNEIRREIHLPLPGWSKPEITTYDLAEYRSLYYALAPASMHGSDASNMGYLPISKLGRSRRDTELALVFILNQGSSDEVEIISALNRVPRVELEQVADQVVDHLGIVYYPESDPSEEDPGEHEPIALPWKSH